ncbi:MAG: DUF11 domain-containing protein [Candidatus Marinimicrobia bacterium]|nr:DUF11 domain-containing protein [Candidatus Neomarinimicrobiota bacterium]
MINSPDISRVWNRIILILFLLRSIALFGQVPAGTVIQNIAHASYRSSGGISYTGSTNLVEFMVDPGYQMKIQMQVDASVVYPGDTLVYHIQLTNTGNISIPEYSILDTLMTGLEAVSTESEALIQGNIIKWTLTDLGSGETRQLDFQLRASPDLPAGFMLQNHAWYVLEDGRSGSSESISVITGAASELKLDLSMDKRIATMGDTLMYAISIQNTGNIASDETYLYTDLPEYVQFLSTSSAASRQNSIISWSIGALGIGAAWKDTLMVQVASFVPINTTITNYTYVSNREKVIGSAEISALINPWTLPISKIAEPGEYEAGDTISYSITLNNTSQWKVTGIVVRDTLPEGLSFISASHGADYSAPVLTWSLGAMEPRTSMTLTLDTRLDASVGNFSDLVNVASVETFNAGKSRDGYIVSLRKAPDLNLQNAAPSETAPGELLTYRLIYDNSGQVSATGISLVDTLPSQVEFVSASHNHSYNETNHSVEFTLADLDVLQGDTLSVTTRVLPLTPNGTQLVNAARISCAENEVSIARSNTMVLAAPALTLEHQSESHLLPGDTLEYVFSFSNEGNGIATGVEIKDTLSTHLSFIRGSGNTSYDPVTRTVTWAIGQLNPDSSASVLLQTKISKPMAPGSSISNSATISCNEGVLAGTTGSTIVHSPLLDVALSATIATAIPGETFGYTIMYRNLGDTTATEIMATDTLPNGVSFISASGGGLYDSEDHLVIWYPQDLLAFAHDSLIVVLQVNSPLENGSLISNKIHLQCQEGNESTSYIDLVVNSSPSLQLSIATQEEVFPGDTLIYQVSYMNAGSDMARDVQIIDTLSDVTHFQSATGLYVYDPIVGVLTWDLGELNSLDDGVFSIKVLIDPSFEDGSNFSNRTWIKSAETAPLSAQVVSTNILPMSLKLSARPNQILGNGIASSTLQAEVLSYSGNPVPDGFPVHFGSDHGTIPTALQAVSTQSGSSFSTLISDTVLSDAIQATIYAEARFSDTRSASDTTTVKFMMGGLEGSVLDYQGNPVSNVVIELQDRITKEILATTTSDASGYYFIFFPRSGVFNLVFTFIDGQGNPVSVTQPVSLGIPENGSVLTNTNSISGWICDSVTGAPVMEEGIEIVLQSVSDGLLKKSETGVSDTTYTDSTGAYLFSDLSPGRYQMSVKYHGVRSYSDGTLDINFTSSGLFVANANIAIRQSAFYMYKTVDKPEASIGDTLTYSIHYGSNQMSIADSVYLVDYLPAGLEFVGSSLETGSGLSLDHYDTQTNQVFFHALGLNVNETPVLTLKALIARHDQSANTLLENTAMLTDGIDTVFSRRDGRSLAKTRIVYPFLKMSKSVNRRIVETGDILTYTVKVENTNTVESAYALTIVDVLPRGFTYRAGSSRLEGDQYANPDRRQSTKYRTELEWAFDDTLKPGESLELKYRVICGIEAREGTLVNEVQTFAATKSGFQLQSNIAEASVVFQRGLFSDRGLVIGKVFFDDNGNGHHNRGEEAVAGVELFTENGVRVTTDKYGKYSIPDIAAGMHAIRVNQSTLPEGCELLLDSPDNLNDARSKIFWIKSGSMAKVNFSVTRMTVTSQLSGVVYEDENRNNHFDENESGKGGIHLILDDSIRTVTDSSGYYLFKDIIHGSHILTLDSLENDSASELEMDSLQLTGMTPMHHELNIEEDSELNVPMSLKNLSTSQVTLGGDSLRLGIEQIDSLSIISTDSLSTPADQGDFLKGDKE